MSNKTTHLIIQDSYQYQHHQCALVPVEHVCHMHLSGYEECYGRLLVSQYTLLVCHALAPILVVRAVPCFTLGGKPKSHTLGNCAHNLINLNKNGFKALRDCTRSN